jgi:hypothetical protein
MLKPKIMQQIYKVQYDLDYICSSSVVAKWSCHGQSRPCHLQISIITGFMSMTPTIAPEVLLALPPLQLTTEAEAKA